VRRRQAEVSFQLATAAFRAFRRFLAADQQLKISLALAASVVLILAYLLQVQWA